MYMYMYKTLGKKVISTRGVKGYLRLLQCDSHLSLTPTGEKAIRYWEDVVK